MRPPLRSAPLLLACLLTGCALARPRLSGKQLEDVAREAYQAARLGDLEAFKGLLDKGLPVNYGRGEEPMLYWAANFNEIGMAKLLIDRGADVNARCRTLETPLHIAAFRRHTEIVKLLLEHGADPDRGGGVSAVSGERYEDTPLIRAVYQGCLECVKLLVAHGADVNKKNTRGLTPFHAALLGQSHREIAEFLLAQTSDVDTVESYEQGTPLIETVARKYFDMAKELVRRGANVNVREPYDGRTPLHYAAMANEAELVELLLSKGADPAAKTRHGLTPLDEAEKAGAAEAVRLLRAAAAGKP